MDTAERRPRLWPSFVVLLAALVGMVVTGVLAAIGAMVFARVQGARFDSATLMERPGMLVLVGALSQIVLLLCVRYLPRLLGDVGAAGWAERVHWRPAGFDPLAAVVMAIGMQCSGRLGLELASLLHAGGGLLVKLGAAADASGPLVFCGLLVAGAFGPGLAEELTFRGLVQTRLVERWGRRWGVVASAVLFGVWHFDVRQGIMATAMGLFLGACALRQRTVVNVVVAHTLSNTFAFVGARWFHGDDTHSWMISVAAIPALAACSLVLKREPRHA